MKRDLGTTMAAAAVVQQAAQAMGLKKRSQSPSSTMATFARPDGQMYTRVWNHGFVVGFIVGALVVLGLLLAWMLIKALRCRNKKSQQQEEHGGKDQQQHERLLELQQQQPLRFSYGALSLATDAFRPCRLLGRGGFGCVYRGVLPTDGSPVAVKQISQGSKQGQREFLAEINIIGRLRHKNLVPLRGWCQERGSLLLVYEFMPNGSLDKLLFFDRTRQPIILLDWKHRYKIAAGVASALAFLHHEQRVLHRDVKASNVMLDADYNARLGDFGLARVVERRLSSLLASSSISSSISSVSAAGTLGYMAPETCRTGRSNEKSDDYSFGILALEIATGRRVLDAELQNNEGLDLLEWVWAKHESGGGGGAILSVADQRLQGAFDKEQMHRLLSVGLLCCHPEPASRPPMRKVCEILSGNAPPMQLPASRFKQPNENPSCCSLSSRFLYSIDSEVLAPR